MKKKLLERTLSVIISLTCSGIVLWLGLSVISTFNPKSFVVQASQVEFVQEGTQREPAKDSAHSEQQSVAKTETGESTTTSTVAPYIVSDKLYKRPDGKYVYQIQEGDTLTSISCEVKIGVDELANLNQIRNMNEISAGAILVLP